jgi:hypothetical protein
MTTAVADLHRPAESTASRTATAARVHWSVYAVLFASTSVLVGVLWDISWHQTIGRDSFLTPAHLAIYFGGVVAGLTCGWVALRTTFAGSMEDRHAAVSFWGFRAPLGAWVCIWGAFAMITSAPFDDWWHNAYGLDVKILSPPHVLLAAGIGAIQVGAMLMALAWQNRAGRRDRRLQLLFVYGAGLLLLMMSILVTEYLQRWDMHRSLFYQVSCAVFPFFLVSAARGSAARWPATLVAAVYMMVTMVMVWILPLFEGRPLLGPIYVQVDRFLPPDPPLLLIVPAAALDLLMQRVGRARDWMLSVAASFTFLIVFLAAQWPFADFLMSTWSRNWIFATHRMAYMVSPDGQQRWWQIAPPDNLIVGLPIALALAFVSVRCGLWWGNWMARVQR